MRIAGIVKSSLIDYPQKASTVIFLGGCNFKCGYCHNPELLSLSEGDGRSHEYIKEDELFSFLQKRKRFIDGVCISGGEPTLNRELPELIAKIKGLGLSIKLDTNGTNPTMLEELLGDKLIDYVAMDIKGPAMKYQEIAGNHVDLNIIKRSANLLIEAYNKIKISCEFRTTVCREQLTKEDLKMMISEHPSAPPWFLQRFNNPGRILDEKETYSAYSLEEMELFGEELCVSVR